jgi:hypothetical protein
LGGKINQCLDMALLERTPSETFPTAESTVFVVNDGQIVVCSGNSLSTLAALEVERSGLLCDLLSAQGRATFPLDIEHFRKWRTFIGRSNGALLESSEALASLWQARLARLGMKHDRAAALFSAGAVISEEP